MLDGVCDRTTKRHLSGTMSSSDKTQALSLASSWSNDSPKMERTTTGFGLFHQCSPNILPFSAAGLADVITSPFRAAFNYPAFHWAIAGLVVVRAAKSRDSPSGYSNNVTFPCRIWKPDWEQSLRALGWCKRLIVVGYVPLLVGYVPLLVKTICYLLCSFE